MYISIIFSILIVINCELKLKMVQILFRHGIRYSLYSELMQNLENYQEQLLNDGQINSLGMRQMYYLGQILRKEYIEDQKFLSPQYIKEEMFIQSSNVNRTLQSAQSFMIGLYPLGTGVKLMENIPLESFLPTYQQVNQQNQYQYIKQMDDNFASPSGIYPFSIHTQGDNDNILNPPCPLLKNKNRIIVNREEKKFNEEYKKYEKIVQKIAKSIKTNQKFNIQNITKLYDVILCQKYMGYDYEISQQEFDTIQYLKAYSKLLSTFKTENCKLIITPYLQFLVQQFDSKIKNQNYHKFIVSSAHDSQILPLMVILNLINLDCVYNDFNHNKKSCEIIPSFSSNLIFELYQNEQDNYVIMVKYNGQYVNLPCGSKNNNKLCYYYDFRQFIENSIVNNYNQQCGIQEYAVYNNGEYRVGIIIIFFQFIFIAWLLMKNQRLKQQQQFQINYRQYDIPLQPQIQLEY
ncbi:hypothetical protein IMG5_074820 [Ichthyophthirius multifiliis]|uniref:Acid phosphatase n=1 Tax=Ichthyophthirius multifiliis TaxID=5932 RepID=G0QQ30_ICHMU|nr:hypothetical protein IMG5_074820 [Ichthyophthirius multifiliis]EGR32672.1 hypothetical protein IMG5_074820 [Ichthyophthirius multifiliis]|eukprot:XP_004036658.1 hypothetical protein IMG5_074820 [Ichthyophthirius multifiliis]